MIITLTGENSFATRRELRQLVDDFMAEHGDLGLERLDGQEAELAKISEALHGLPFMTAKKLVILRAPGTNKTFIEQAEQLLNDLPDTTDVIIVEPKLDKRLGYYKFLRKHTDFRDFPELDSGGLVRWLSEAAKAQGGAISPVDARYLVERVGTNQQLLSNELDKLLLYEPQVSRRTIDVLTDAAPQSTVFQLLEAAFAGRRERALELYAQQRAQRVEPAQIIAMLAWQLHVLAIIKTASLTTTQASDRATGDHPTGQSNSHGLATRSTDQIAREAKLNPYVVSKSQGIARHLTLPQLKKLINDLLAIDLKTKRTSLDPDEALQHYLLILAD